MKDAAGQCRAKPGIDAVNGSAMGRRMMCRVSAGAGAGADAGGRYWGRSWCRCWGQVLGAGAGGPEEEAPPASAQRRALRRLQCRERYNSWKSSSLLSAWPHVGLRAPRCSGWQSPSRPAHRWLPTAPCSRVARTRAPAAAVIGIQTESCPGANRHRSHRKIACISD